MLTTAIVAAVWVLLFYFLIPSLGSSKQQKNLSDYYLSIILTASLAFALIVTIVIIIMEK